jgi:dihydropyrimidinase
MRLLVANGTVVNAAGAARADVLVQDGVVAQVGPRIDPAGADRVIDAAGRLVLPGGVDVHVHLGLDAGGIVTADDFESGTVAAAHGGTTTVVDFGEPPPGAPLREGLAELRGRAEGRAAIDYSCHLVVRQVTPALLDETDALVREGVTSFKFFTAYPGRYMLDDAAAFRLLQRLARNGGLATVHAENGPAIELLREQAVAAGRLAPAEHARTRPARLEAEAVARVLALAEVAGAQLHVVHVSTAEGAAELRAARGRGVAATGETCPQYLCFSDERYDAPFDEAAGFVMTPPLRRAGNDAALWLALADGGLQMVATDHCSFSLADKRRGRERFDRIPNGGVGIETRLLATWEAVRDGRLTPARWVELNCAAPARRFGLHPRKGVVAPGSDADLVIWDPEREVRLSAATHHTRVDYEPFEGRVFRGAPALVLLRGEPVVEDGRFTGRAGAGRFLRRGLPDRPPPA